MSQAITEDDVIAEAIWQMAGVRPAFELGRAVWELHSAGHDLATIAAHLHLTPEQQVFAAAVVREIDGLPLRIVAGPFVVTRKEAA